MKRCPKCGAEKNEKEFAKNASRRDKLQSECRNCKVASIRRCHFTENGKAYRRRASLLFNYGITTEDYDALLKAQGGRCAICGRPPKVRVLAVDHCHRTGLVRGLLCWRHNQGLGNFGDDINLLRSAVNYLKTPPALAAIGPHCAPKKARKYRVRRPTAVGTSRSGRSTAPTDTLEPGPGCTPSAS